VREPSPDLGACHYLPHDGVPRRRVNDPPTGPGQGRLTFADEVYDFSALFQDRHDHHTIAKDRPATALVESPRHGQAGVQDYTMNLLYDLQVYRAAFDEIDRQLALEPEEVREEVQEVATRREYPRFAQFLDAKAQRDRRVDAGVFAAGARAAWLLFSQAAVGHHPVRAHHGANKPQAERVRGRFGDDADALRQ